MRSQEKPYRPAEGYRGLEDHGCCPSCPGDNRKDPAGKDKTIDMHTYDAFYADKNRYDMTSIVLIRAEAT